MAADSRPTVLPLLETDPSEAADDALLAALLEPTTSARAAILEVLVRRGRAHAGIELIRLFATASADLKGLIAQNAQALHSPLRSMIASAELADRLAGIELIVYSGDFKSAYLLAETLRHRCPRTREAAAKALQQMTETLLARLGPAGDPERAGLCGDLDEVAAAVGEGVRAWESHLQPSILSAALQLIDRTESHIRQKLTEGQSRFAHAITGAIASAAPGLAGALLRCLGIPELRSEAGQRLARAHDRALIQAILHQAWLTYEPSIEHGCRSIRKDRWEPDWPAALASAPPDAMGPALRLVAATGGSATAKLDLFREMLGREDRRLRFAILWRLVEDGSEPATQLLTAIAARSSDELAPVARRECRRRGAQKSTWLEPSGLTNPSAEVQPGGSEALKSPAQDLTFGRATGTVTAPDLSRASVATAGSHLGPPHNPSALDRLEALQRVNSSGAVSDHADAVYSACNDPDPSVRAVGISLLAQIPGAATIRLLRQALNDRDPRVQANAIEVLDAIGFAERVHWIADKMKSADSRVRANAIRSCLRAEMYQAAEALLAMIESESSAHRVSALWLVEKLRLRTLLPRVQEIMEKDPDPRVRGRAKRICLRLAGQSQSAPVVHAEGSGESHGGLARQ